MSKIASIFIVLCLIVTAYLVVRTRTIMKETDQIWEKVAEKRKEAVAIWEEVFKIADETDKTNEETLKTLTDFNKRLDACYKKSLEMLALTLEIDTPTLMDLMDTE